MYWNLVPNSTLLSWTSLKKECYSRSIDQASWPSLKISLKHGSWEAAYQALAICKTNDMHNKKLNEGLCEVAKGGHKHLVDFFISKGANDWNWGMQGAAQGGHRDLVELFVAKGASNWNEGMRSAAFGGHKDLVEFFVAKGANHWNWSMQGAAFGGHKDLVDFFISKGATPVD